MTLGGSASNTELSDHVANTLVGKPRTRMNEFGLVESEKRGQTFHHTLTDKGWARCAAELDGSAPPRQGPLGRVLYGVLGVIKGYLDVRDTSLAEFVVIARGESAPEPASADLTQSIRDAYWRLAREPQDWVLLTELRPLLGDAPRDQVDEALRLLGQVSGVHFTPEADQKTLSEDDRRAAVFIGGESKHLLAIEAR
ncbi:hypothetical protein DP939_26900 [Spongiactinospora rosea]|uniref:Uncharacterized protein n=2 Tax=Spongiactinospora rosea TaxID=2248750 RepID=A0A366LTC4_9ACTN|nr:hypothetical protein DP939_26900 [Spongiactinospora rosea]